MKKSLSMYVAGISKFILLLAAFPFSTANEKVTELPFLDLGDDARVAGDGKFFGVDDDVYMLNQTELPSFISFPFGNGSETSVYITSNGLICFGTPYTAYNPRQFPIEQKVIAPYWDDIDLSHKGLVLFASLIQGQKSRLSDVATRAIFDIVNDYLSDTVIRGTTRFRAHWILAARWIDVCPFGNAECSGIGTNTFQAVIATDGTRSYAIYTYKCGELNWVKHAANIGYSASTNFSAEHFLSHNSTNINDIACINLKSVPPSNWSNVVYKVNNVSDLVIVYPPFGNREGDSGVVVSGPRFSSNDNVQCIFDGEEVDAQVLNDENAVLCTTPRQRRTGRVPVRVRRNQVVLQEETQFYSVPFERSSVVDIEIDSLLLRAGRVARLRWPRELLLPPLESVNTDNGVVSIRLYERNMSSESEPFRELAMLAPNIPNTGQIDVVIPDLSNLVTESVCPVSINVEIRSLPQSPNLPPTPQYTFSQWTGEVYLATDTLFHDKCQEWVNSQPSGIGEEILSRVSTSYPCPPTVNRVLAPNSGFERDFKGSQLLPTNYFNNLLRQFFHPGTSQCYRQSGGFEETNGHGNQCCYDNQGNIIVGAPGGGTVDRFAPGKSIIDHFLEDVLPFIWCCKGEFSNCRDTYYRYRPSDDGSRYMPAPPACVYGDPHLVTLDLHKYTFNGYGEFVLIETMDDSFTLQGRMVEATTDSTLNIPSTGTIFSALVAKESRSDTAQLQLDPFDGITALVNGERIDFTDITEQEFNNLTVADLGNRTIVATFSSGAFLKVQEENGIISVLIVSLPSSYQNKTRGLMGNYNGDKSDDLIPRGATESLSLDSTLQDIHENFGITWIINNKEDSLFSYRAGENWTTFYRPQYSPLYGPVFATPELKAMAEQLCKNDTFCLYDIAATGRVELGMTTLRGSEDFEELVELSAPVVCNPPCENGACVDNNTCRCSEGYIGSTCNSVVYTECTQNPCRNQGTCQILAGSYLCICNPEYTGDFCEDEIPRPTESTDVPINNNQLYIIIGAFGGGALLIVLVVVIVTMVSVLCLCRKSNKHAKMDPGDGFPEKNKAYEYMMSS